MPRLSIVRKTFIKTELFSSGFSCNFRHTLCSRYCIQSVDKGSGSSILMASFRKMAMSSDVSKCERASNFLMLNIVRSLSYLVEDFLSQVIVSSDFSRAVCSACKADSCTSLSVI